MNYENTYRAYAVPYSEAGSSINYEITIHETFGGHIGRTQAETAADVELMTRDWLDTMGYNGDAPLDIQWVHHAPDGHRRNGATTA